MNTHLTSADKFNELLFENKNKAYGAYAIRKSQSDHISISLLVTTAFFGFLVVLTFVLGKTKIEIPDIISNEPVLIPTIEREIILEKPLEQPKPKVAEAPKTTSGNLTASDDKQNDLDKIKNSLPFSKDPNPFGKTDSVAPKDPGIVAPLPPKKKDIVSFVKKMPKLDGMAEFIKDHLRYPQVAKENGTEGTVYVTFVVETDGSITDIKLLKGIGDGCEQEAMRVVGLMPTWEPGSDDDGPARVQCNLPIRFRLSK